MSRVRIPSPAPHNQRTSKNLRRCANAVIRELPRYDVSCIARRVRDFPKLAVRASASRVETKERELISALVCQHPQIGCAGLVVNTPRSAVLALVLVARCPGADVLGESVGAANQTWNVEDAFGPVRT